MRRPRSSPGLTSGMPSMPRIVTGAAIDLTSLGFSPDAERKLAA
jgi:hypothetical protein